MLDIHMAALASEFLYSKVVKLTVCSFFYYMIGPNTSYDFRGRDDRRASCFRDTAQELHD